MINTSRKGAFIVQREFYESPVFTKMSKEMNFIWLSAESSHIDYKVRVTGLSPHFDVIDKPAQIPMYDVSFDNDTGYVSVSRQLNKPSKEETS